MQRRSQGNKGMEARNEGFERLKRIIASKEPEEEEPPDEARRKVDDCLFGENSYNEIFYKTLLSMRGELMDYLDSNPEDDNLTATIRSAIVGVTQAEEVYEMMVEMNRIGFEDSDCEDQGENPSTCVDLNDPGTNEEPDEAEKLLPAFSITDEKVIDHTLKTEADETIDDMDLALHGANKLREYIAELYPDENVRTEECIESRSMDDETTEELKNDRGIIPGDGELASEISISGVINRDPTLISECGEGPIIEGRVFDIGKDTRPMEPSREASFEAPPTPLYVGIQVSSETLPGTERDYDSQPIKPGKDPGERLRTTQNRNEDEDSSCSSTMEAHEMNLCFLGAIKLFDYDKGTHSGENVCIGSYLEPEQQDKDVEEGIQTNHGTRPDDEKSKPKVYDLKPFNQGIPHITTTGVEPAMEGRIFDVGKDARPMESDSVTKSEESPKMETHPDHDLNMEESQATTDKGTPVSLKPLPKIVKVYESEPIKPGKDPGTSSNLAQKSKEDVNSNCSRVWKIKGTETWEPGKPASNGTRNEVKVLSEDSSTSPEKDISHDSIPINPGKDPGIRDETTTGTSKTRRRNDRDIEARIVKDKSGGIPLVSKKQIKPGWDPPRTSIHRRVSDEIEDIVLTYDVGEKKFEVSLTRETCSNNGKTRGFEMSNDNGLPINVKTMENEASKKNVVFSNDLRKYLEKSLRPSHKMKEKVNSKCSRVWRVKDSKSTEAWMVKNKSGGKPLTFNKRLKRGWDPPAIHSF